MLNEFKDGFYKFWGVEADIRTIAETFPNSYMMAFFACCRELKQPSKHTEGISLLTAKTMIKKLAPEKIDEMEAGSGK